MRPSSQTDNTASSDSKAPEAAARTGPARRAGRQGANMLKRGAFGLRLSSVMRAGRKLRGDGCLQFFCTLHSRKVGGWYPDLSQRSLFQKTMLRSSQQFRSRKNRDVLQVEPTQCIWSDNDTNRKYLITNKGGSPIFVNQVGQIPARFTRDVTGVLNYSQRQKASQNEQLSNA